MPPGPGLFISGSFLAGYAYWRFSFRQVTSALRLERAGQIDQARELFQAFLRNRNPLTRRGESRHRCSLLLARLERKSGRYADAVLVAEEILTSNASPGIKLAAMQIRADSFAWGGDLDAALAGAVESLPAAKDSRIGNFEREITGLLCRIRTWRGEMDEAIRLAEGLIAQGGPTGAYGYLRMSEINCAQGDYAAAAHRARRLLDALDADRNADRNAGEDAGGDADPSAGTDASEDAGQVSSTELTAAKSSDPGSSPSERLDPGKAGASVWKALAAAYGARAAYLGGGHDRAREWLADAAAGQHLPVSDAVGWWGLQALAAREAGDNAASEQHLAAMRQISDGASSGYGSEAGRHYYEGRILMADRRFEEAADELVRAVRAQPPADALPEYYYHLGLALEQSGKDGAAGAFTCGGRLPPAFHFTSLCRARTALDSSDRMRIES